MDMVDDSQSQGRNSPKRPFLLNIAEIDFEFLSPSGDLGIGLVWDNNRTGQLFGPTVKILSKLN